MMMMMIQLQQVCVQPRPWAVNVTLPTYAAERPAAAPLLLGAGFRCCRSIFPARTALSSKPVARRCCCRSMGQTDGRTLDRFVDPAVRSMRAVSLNNYKSTANQSENASAQSHLRTHRWTDNPKS